MPTPGILTLARFEVGGVVGGVDWHTVTVSESTESSEIDRVTETMDREFLAGIVT
jgi:hypothetical protein